jgi:uncharacterized protein (AIM24 family)
MHGRGPLPAGPAGRSVGQVIAHKLLGAGQTLVAQLDAGQALWCVPGRVLWTSPNVAVRLRPPGGDPGQATGVVDAVVAAAVEAGRRGLAGDPLALPHLTPSGGSGLVALAGPAPGELRALEVGPDRAWLVAWDALVGAEGSVGLVATGDPGPLRLHRLAGTGSLFVAGAGGLVELEPGRFGGSARADPGRVVAFQEEVELAAGGGGRLAALTGEGVVLLQSAARPATTSQG